MEVRGALRMLKHMCPCHDCRARFPYYVMDFDHVRGTHKRKHRRLKGGLAGLGIATMAATASWKTIRAEVEKCDIVCANCHKIRTHKRRAEDG